MKTPRRQLASIITKRTLNSNVNAHGLSREVAAYLLENGRGGELDSLMRNVIKQRASKGIVEVIAISAHELTDEVRAEIKSQVLKLYPEAKEVIISRKYDPKLIGGIRLELVDRQLDLTVRSQLNRFKQLTAAERINA